MPTDWAAIARRAMEGDDEAVILGLIQETIVDQVAENLDWNVRAYGKAWTGEGEDTDFIVGESAALIVERLREAGLEVVRTRG